jgi:hypothetical protein
MTEALLAVIAASVFVMALVQILAARAAARAAARGAAVLEQLGRDLGPTVVSLQTLAADAARTASVVAARMERADVTLTRLANRVEHVEGALSTRWLEPARRGLARLTRKGRSVDAVPKPTAADGDEPGSD